MEQALRATALVSSRITDEPAYPPTILRPYTYNTPTSFGTIGGADARSDFRPESRAGPGAHMPPRDNFQPRAPAGPKTPEDREAVRTMAQDIRQKLANVPSMPRVEAVRERAPASPLYLRLMGDGLRAAREGPPTEAMRLAATLDGRAQGRLAPGRAITPRMVEHFDAQPDGYRAHMAGGTAENRAKRIAQAAGAPIPPGGRDPLAPASETVSPWLD